MKKLTLYKKLNLAALAFSLIASLSVYMFIKLGYCAKFCSIDSKVGVIDPLYNFFLGLTIITAVFLILPAQYFKTWLRFILPVAAILILFHALSVSVYTSSILSMSRAETVRFDMVVLGVISLVVVAIQAMRSKQQKN